MSQEKNNHPIFIVGVPRSGTTLISSMLSAHPNIAISPETHFLNHWAKPNLKKNLCSQKDIDSFWENFSQSDRFSHFGIDAQQVKSIFETSADKVDYKTIFSSLLKTYAHKLKKNRWGEKTPSHYLHVETLLEWYPQARVIWVLRDPRAVVASLLKVNWASSYTHLNAYLWRNNTNLLKEKWIKDSRIKVVKYESLIINPEKALEEICNFIGEKYHSSMLNQRSLKSSPVVNRSGWAETYLKNTLRPIDTNSIRKWKSQLSSSQIAIIEHICRQGMSDNEYITESKGLTPVQLFIFLKLVISHKIERRAKSLKRSYFRTLTF